MGAFLWSKAGRGVLKVDKVWVRWYRKRLFWLAVSWIIVRCYAGWTDGSLCKLHAVKEGETLSSIAYQYGVTVEQLRAANGMNDFPEKAPLREGSVLLIPLASANSVKAFGDYSFEAPSHDVKAFFIYEAKEGETVEEIASSFKVPVKALCEANKNIKPGMRLRNGTVLLIPILVGVSKAESSQNKVTNPDRPKRVETNTTAVAKPSQGNKDSMNVSSLQRSSLPSPLLRTQTATSFANIAIVKRQSFIYSAPTTNSVRYYLCNPGKKLLVVDRRGNWFGVLMVNGAVGWIWGDAITLTNDAVSVSASWLMPSNRTQLVRYDGTGYAIVREAMRYLNVPYKYGGNSMNGIDCSALVQKVYAAFGIRLPRRASEQCAYGFPVEFSQLQPGDRIYFAGRDGQVNHCGIYIGDGKFIHASGRHGKVTISSLYEPRYFNSFYCARR